MQCLLCSKSNFSPSKSRLLLSSSSLAFLASLIFSKTFWFTLYCFLLPSNLNSCSGWRVDVRGWGLSNGIPISRVIHKRGRGRLQFHYRTEVKVQTGLSRCNVCYVLRAISHLPKAGCFFPHHRSRSSLP